MIGKSSYILARRVDEIMSRDYAANGRTKVKIHAGFQIEFDLEKETSVLLKLHLHHSEQSRLCGRENFEVDPSVATEVFFDHVENKSVRLVAPSGHLTLFNDFIVHDNGEPDPIPQGAGQLPVHELPFDVYQYLLQSRYCETDLMVDRTEELFGKYDPGYPRVQAICDWVHERITYSYDHASPTKTAIGVMDEQFGVCRDFQHLAITFCRCLEIPARYVSGYLGDISVPARPEAMDFHAWFEVWLEGTWYAFDARYNQPRVGRIAMAKGRDAADTAFATTFAPATLTNFKVWTDEVT